MTLFNSFINEAPKHIIFRKRPRPSESCLVKKLTGGLGTRICGLHVQAPIPYPLHHRHAPYKSVHVMENRSHGEERRPRARKEKEEHCPEFTIDMLVLLSSFVLRLPFSDWPIKKRSLETFQPRNLISSLDYCSLEVDGDFLVARFNKALAAFPKETTLATSKNRVIKFSRLSLFCQVSLPLNSQEEIKIPKVIQSG